MPRKQHRSPVGLALAGGGPLGGIYEIGALAALAESLDGLDFNELDVYVGVSSGAFIAAGLANGVAPLEMCRMFVESDSHHEPFDPAILLKPALREYVRSAAALPPLLLSSLWHFASRPAPGRLVEALRRLGTAIPAGLFDNASIDAELARLFSVPGRTNDFRRLRRKLYLVATDLDSGQSVRFGTPGHDRVPISTAVLASAALPGLFPPVEIDGRHYVDGALKRTLHASVALEQGVKLLLCVNPLVPFHSSRKLAEGGLPVVLAQTFRAVIHSRMQVGMQRYAREFRDADVVLFEPNRSDADMFFTNLFSYAGRHRLAEHAYQKTRAELVRRRHELAPVLGRHGVALNMAVLNDADRHLVRGARVGKARLASSATTGRLADCLDDLERWLRTA